MTVLTRYTNQYAARTADLGEGGKRLLLQLLNAKPESDACATR